MNKETNFVCTYCGHRFSIENRYMQHKCKQMIREEEIKTAIGQQAWGYYQKWMKTSHKLTPQIRSFLHSKYYGSFIRFAAFVQKQKIADPNIYIELMVTLEMGPVLWTNDQVYIAYIEHMDKVISPQKHAEITINTLFSIADNTPCDLENIFDNIDPNEVILLFKQRKLSPWLLLHSSKFKRFLLTRLSSEQRTILETIIRPQHWTTRLKKHPEAVKVMKRYIEEMNL